MSDEHPKKRQERFSKYRTRFGVSLRVCVATRKSSRSYYESHKSNEASRVCVCTRVGGINANIYLQIKTEVGQSERPVDSGIIKVQ